MLGIIVGNLRKFGREEYDNWNSEVLEDEGLSEDEKLLYGSWISLATLDACDAVIYFKYHLNCTWTVLSDEGLLYWNSLIIPIIASSLTQPRTPLRQKHLTRLPNLPFSSLIQYEELTSRRPNILFTTSSNQRTTNNALFSRSHHFVCPYYRYG